MSACSRAVKSSGDQVRQRRILSFLDRLIGSIRLQAVAPGFEQSESEPVNLASARTVNIEVMLHIGTLRQQIVVSDTGTSLPESQVGASLTVINQSELDSFNKLDLLNAIRQVPGLAVVQTGERGAPLRFSPAAAPATSTRC